MSEEKKDKNTFFSSIKSGFDNFSKSLEDMAQKNKEQWKENTDKVNGFFKGMKEKWDTQVQKWADDIEKAKQENDEKWQASVKKVENDFNSWQDQVRKDWKDGVKEWNKGVVKGAYIFLIAMIPIIIVFFVVAYILRNVLGVF